MLKAALHLHLFLPHTCLLSLLGFSKLGIHKPQVWTSHWGRLITPSALPSFPEQQGHRQIKSIRTSTPMEDFMKLPVSAIFNLKKKKKTQQFHSNLIQMLQLLCFILCGSIKISLQTRVNRPQVYKGSWHSTWVIISLLPNLSSVYALSTSGWLHVYPWGGIKATWIHKYSVNAKQRQVGGGGLGGSALRFSDAACERPSYVHLHFPP